MANETVGVVLDFKRKRVTTVIAGNTKDEQTLADALARQVKGVATGVAQPPPEQKQK